MIGFQLNEHHYCSIGTRDEVLGASDVIKTVILKLRLLSRADSRVLPLLPGRTEHGPEIFNITLDPARKCRISGLSQELLNQKLQFNDMIALVSRKLELEKECYKVSTGAR
ncbi:small integral membrane protein 36 isoform 1-T1 [Glossophaga mutica]